MTESPETRPDGTGDQPGRPAIDPDAGGDDFATEHDATGTDPDGRDEGETESPHGRSGLESTKRPD